MGLVVTITSASQLEREFSRFGRGDSFSHDGYKAIVEYFDDLGEETELDVIAVDCDFAESSIADFLDNYSVPCSSFEEWSEDNEDDDSDNYDSYLVETVKAFIERHGSWYELIDYDSRIVYQSF